MLKVRIPPGFPRIFWNAITNMASPSPSIIVSQTASGDFVAMMQGGAVDHQRAADAVAQVTFMRRSSFPGIVSKLTITLSQLCERIDSTLDIRCARRG
jgi:hypothetical protein